ncbi:unnamed protein product (macronuclear) [Paramecium tetraurelia]|uniref:Uncharacterized protein n=1 Tax=Paramecium tetraurelia TaxID=5888 RepID=A0D9V6_PARTE|nr:uncharacterized protein GSPATT00014754001 [Paramecium tetraurelia]CAK79823.1 unnamed protein product [Paramecium tetraurelia]|eukprot:XP_001447220.1 hypothetical protein (macronuclear) [Paramecium tetraurelia strain d4-2]
MIQHGGFKIQPYTNHDYFVTISSKASKEAKNHKARTIFNILQFYKLCITLPIKITNTLDYYYFRIQTMVMLQLQQSSALSFQKFVQYFYTIQKLDQQDQKQIVTLVQCDIPTNYNEILLTICENVESLWNYRLFNWIWLLSIIDPHQNYQINKGNANIIILIIDQLRSDDSNMQQFYQVFLILVSYFDIGFKKSDEMIQESQSQNSQLKNVQ